MAALVFIIGIQDVELTNCKSGCVGIGGLISKRWAAFAIFPYFLKLIVPTDAQHIEPVSRAISCNTLVGFSPTFRWYVDVFLNESAFTFRPGQERKLRLMGAYQQNTVRWWTELLITAPGY